MKGRRTAMLLAALGWLAPAALGQDYWVKKEYTKWSDNECKRLLENSPWSQSWGNSKVHGDAFGQATGERARESETRLRYVAQIRSANPVRKALVRKMMIDAKYDKMTPEQKEAVDQQASQFLAAEFPDSIVIVVQYSVSVPAWETELANLWQSVPPNSVPVETTLIGPRGERVLPLRYTHRSGSSREFQLIFPRHVNGEPLLKPGDKSFALELFHPGVGIQREQGTLANPVATGTDAFPRERVYFEFKVDKMTIGNQVVH